MTRIDGAPVRRLGISAEVVDTPPERRARRIGRAVLLAVALLSGAALDSARARLVSPDPPSITSDPSSQTVCVGDAATFTVAASGTDPLVYQWRKDGADISGATSSTYSIASVQASDAGSYDVVVTNGCGSATSGAAALAVEVAPSITGDPSSDTVCTGDAASFTVAATGTAPLAYQWRKNGADIPGATSSTYSIASVQASDAGSYDAVVTNGCGSATSGAAALAAAEPPSITAHPASQTVCAGDAVTFTVTASGTAPLGYQWRKNGADIPLATSSTYSIPSAQAGDAGSYDAVVSNSCASATSNAASLAISADSPSVTSHPASQTVCAGTPVTLNVTATGAPPLAYQWRKNGSAIPGATGTAYSLASPQPSDSGAYDVVVSNGCGSATSNAATVTIEDAPTVTTHPASQAVCRNTRVTFTVVATGLAPLAYQWRKNGADISGAIQSSIVIASAQPIDAAAYDVVVTNSCGSVTSNAATLTIQVAPSIATHPSSQSICLGAPVTFGVTASGDAPLSYQWRKNAVAIPGATSSSYSIASVQSANAGNYSVVVTNACGSATSNAAVLTVLTPPAVSVQPVSHSACVGASDSFFVAATGTAPFTYQWRRNGAAVPGGTSQTLAIGSVALSHAGDYDVIVTNACGSATSVTATLTVVEVAPTIVSEPSSLTVCEGEPASFDVVATGSAPISYQWGKDGVPLPGATAPTHAIASTTLADSGSYAVVVTNACGFVRSGSATLTVLARVPVSVTLSPDYVAGAGSVPAAVEITCPAPAGGAVVSLSTDSPSAAAVPPTVTIPQGSTSAPFVVTTSAVADTESVTITASLNGGTAQALLKVMDAETGLLTGPGAEAAYYYDVPGDVGTLDLSATKSWAIVLEDADGSRLSGDKRFHVCVEDRGAGTGGESFGLTATLDFAGAGGHLLECVDLGSVVRSSHEFDPGEVTGPFGLALRLTQLGDGRWHVDPWFRSSATLPWTPFEGGSFTTATAFDLTASRIVARIDLATDGSFCFAAPAANDTSCLRGTARSADGTPADNLFVNGSAGDPEGVVTAALREEIAVSMVASSFGPDPGGYAMYVWRGGIVNPQVMTVGGTTLGCTVNPTPFNVGETPKAFRCLSGLGPEYCEGLKVLAGSPASVPWTRRKRSGFGAPATFTMQGVVSDDGAPGTANLSVTNAVILEIR